MTFQRTIAKRLLYFLYRVKGRSKGIIIDRNSIISRVAFKRLLENDFRDFPIKIKDSEIGNVKIGQGCKFNKVLCSGNITIGDFVSINGPATRLSSHKNFISIGNYTSIASNVVIQEHSHNKSRLTSYYIFANTFKEESLNEIISKGPIIIEEDVWIGSNVTILSGVKIGRGAIIGAGSVVTKDIPKYSIAVGNPARVISKRFDNEVIEKLEYSKWWEQNPSYLKKYKELFELELDKENAKTSFISTDNF